MTELRGSATITVQSEYDASYLKANAVDGNTATEWATSAGGSSSWIQFNWGSPVTIREIRLINRANDAWSNPRFTFSDATYSEGSISLVANQDATFVLLHPKTTTSLRISVAPESSTTGSNTGFKEVYINDAYSVAPSTDLTKPDHLIVSSYYGASWEKWRVIDGNTATEWATYFEGAASYITFEWLEDVYIESLQIRDRNSTDRWGTPRFTFDDASTQDGSGAVDNTGYTTYTLSTPKTTTSIKISVASGGNGDNRGLAEVIITGNVTPPGGGGGARINATGIQIIG